MTVSGHAGASEFAVACGVNTPAASAAVATAADIARKVRARIATTAQRSLVSCSRSGCLFALAMDMAFLLLDGFVD
jgi:hypothetical protein